MIFAIDGTGPDDHPGRVHKFISETTVSVRKRIEATRVGGLLPKVEPAKTYAQEMTGSFCNQIGAAPNATYFQGPSLLGTETSAIADRVVDAVLAGKAKAPSSAIMLAGYSRGGCSAIIAARRLKGKGVNIDSLFLFDAVDMQGSDMHIARTIPDNVAFVAHVRSARDLGFWAVNPVKSRFYFYNTGLGLAGHGLFVSKSFVGSHAALGGVPWTDIKHDQGCALGVAEWMNSQFKERLNVTLKVIGKSV